MKRVALVLPFLIACIAEPDDLADVESAGTSYQGTSYQGTSYQGTSYQGTSYQGTSYQGTSYQGTSYQGASYGGTALSSAAVNNTTLEVWKAGRIGTWEQRLPDRICTQNLKQSQPVCTYVNLATTPSPLAGVTFQASFVDPTTGATRQGTLRIGSGPNDLYAVRADTSLAMHPLNGSGAFGALYGVNSGGCTHPNGCRVNSNLWLMNVQLIDTNGTAVNFCKGTEQAIALADTWDLTGARSASTTTFTFACTNGTIAKCTRWGYRPFGNATKNNGETVAMADYHQACVRAATADYCANGTSFTKDGTLIDIWDYQPHQPGAAGFVPRIVSMHWQDADPPTAFEWESTFDKLGGAELDFVRYSELGNLSNACPGKFALGTAPQPGEPHVAPQRNSPTWVAPYVSVDNTTVCSHDETTIGRWLHPECSVCTGKLWSMFPTNACLNRGPWNQVCVNLANNYCTATEKMATHSECTAGAALHLYDSACTLNVCGSPGLQGCCSSGWTSSCTAAANQMCTGGQEHPHPFLAQRYGFCNILIKPGANGG